jgi:hypothetical protein
MSEKVEVNMGMDWYHGNIEQVEARMNRFMEVDRYVFFDPCSMTYGFWDYTGCPCIGFTSHFECKVSILNITR